MPLPLLLPLPLPLPLPLLPLPLPLPLTTVQEACTCAPPAGEEADGPAAAPSAVKAAPQSLADHTPSPLPPAAVLRPTE
jgi:hypothetical protein